MDSIQPAPDCKELYHRHEIDGFLFKSGCQSSHVLHFAKEPFDNVAHGIEIFVVRYWNTGVTLGWDHSQRTLIGDLLPDFCTAICLVSNDGEWRNFPIKEGIDHLAVMQLTAADFQSKRASFGVYSRVNLTCATAA